MELHKRSYKNLIDILNNGGEKIIRDYFIDKDANEVNFENVEIKCKDLIPTQSEIDLVLSLKPLLKGKNNILEKVFKTIPIAIIDRIIVYDNKYIMDGHHRWAELVLLNPECPIKCINMITKINISPIDMLSAIQMSIYDVIKSIPTSKVSGSNLLTINKEEFTSYIINNGNELFTQIITTQALPNFLLGDKNHTNVKSIKSIEDLSEFLYENLLLMKEHNKPISGAPNRSLMPQTSGNSKNTKEEKLKLKKQWHLPLQQGKISLNRFKSHIKKYNEFNS
jgi:hypothetical protein